MDDKAVIWPSLESHMYLIIPNPSLLTGWYRLYVYRTYRTQHSLPASEPRRKDREKGTTGFGLCAQTSFTGDFPTAAHHTARTPKRSIGFNIVTNLHGSCLRGFRFPARHNFLQKRGGRDEKDGCLAVPCPEEMRQRGPASWAGLRKGQANSVGERAEHAENNGRTDTHIDTFGSWVCV